MTTANVDDDAGDRVEQAARAADHPPGSLVAKYREMAADSDRERDAEEWSEGLVADGDTPRSVVTRTVNYKL